MGARKYIKQLLTEVRKQIDSNMITVGNFNTDTPLTSMDRSSRQMALNEGNTGLK